MGLLDFIRDEYGKAKKSYGLLSGIPKTFKNNPRNAETMDAVFGFGGIIPGIGDAVSAAEAKYRYDQGDMLGAGLAGLGALPMVPALAGTFIGKKGINNLGLADVLKQAEAMEKAGKSRDEIWEATAQMAANKGVPGGGIGRGVDKQWRFELDDSKSAMESGGRYFGTKGGGGKANQVLEHNDLFKAYPDVGNINTNYNFEVPKHGGSFNGNFISVDAPMGYQSAKDTTLHELQHAIQQREGFARGGNPKDAWDFLQEENGRLATLRSIGNSAERYAAAKELEKYSDLLKSKDKYDAYRRLAGEAEARLTQSRMNMTPLDRQMLPPWSQKELGGYDVPESQQIVRFGDGPAMAINPSEYGLPVNPDGTVSLLHGTTKDAANKIIGENRLRSAGEPSVYLTNANDAGYGDGTLVQVDVDPRKLFLDDEFPGGRFDFSMPVRGGVANVKNARMYGDGPAMSTGRPRNHLGQEIPPTPYELAHAEAQRVAALPVEQGGLGLPPNNTAMDRARVMGFDTDAYHGTNANITEFDHARLGAQTGNPNTALGTFATQDPVEASRYTKDFGKTLGGNVLPLRISTGNSYPMPYVEANDLAMGIFTAPGNTPRERIAAARQIASARKDSLIKEGYDSATVNAGHPYEEIVSFDPSRIRSRFAAFNPAKRDSADLLAGLAPWALPVGATLLGGSFLLPPEEY